MDKHLPANIDAERATLGALLLERDGILVVAAWLAPDHFVVEKHRWVYEAVLACYQQRIPPDVQTVADELRRRDRLANVGDIPFLIELSDAVPTAYHVEYYARIVERTAFLRTVIQVGGKIAALGFDEAGDVAAVASTAQALLTNALVRKEASGPVEMGSLLTEMEEAMSSETAPGQPTGFVDYDRLTGGLHPGDLLILAARPGVGKSALALNMCHRLLVKGAGRIIFVSLEMPRLQLMHRLISLQTGIPAKALRENRLSQSQLQVVVNAMGQMHQWPLAIDDAGELSFAELRLRILRDVAANGSPALIVVDYLQLVSSPQGRDSNRVQEVGAVSRGLKALAKEAGCPILALSQLSRAVEGRTNHVPMLSDLRESGGLEQDADQVLFIYREELYDKDTDKKGVVELHIAKHRNGPVGVVPLFFEGERMQFRDLEGYRTPDGY